MTMTIVFIHGMFGWGNLNVIDGEDDNMSYFPIGEIRRALRGRAKVAFVDLGIASSDHDRACEAYAQLRGSVVDYGEKHARKCGHLRFGREYSKPLVKCWNESHPIAFVGHSFGGNTAIELARLVSEDYWKEGTSSSYIHSVSCICSPLRGTSLPFRLGLLNSSSSSSVIRAYSFSHFLSVFFGIIFLIQRDYPMMIPRSLFDIKSDQWGNVTTWRNVFDRNHIFWTSRDNTICEVTPKYRSSRHFRDNNNNNKNKWIKVSVVSDVVKPLSFRSEVIPFGCLVVLAMWKFKRRRVKNLLVGALLLFMTGLFAFGKRVRRNLFHAFIAHPFLRLCAKGCKGPSDGIVELSSCTSTHGEENNDEWHVIQGPQGSNHCLGTWASAHSSAMYRKLLNYLLGDVVDSPSHEHE
jgi:hypothetical protein